MDRKYRRERIAFGIASARVIAAANGEAGPTVEQRAQVDTLLLFSIAEALSMVVEAPDLYEGARDAAS